MKHEFAAVFGRESAKIFDGLWQLRLDINHAVDFMLRNKEMQRSETRRIKNFGMNRIGRRSGIRNRSKMLPAGADQVIE
jgi:hypothetical protein